MCPLHYGSLWTTVSIIHSIKRSGRSLLHLKGHFNLSDGQQGCKPTGFKKKYDYMEAYEKMTPLFTWSVSSVNTFLMSLQSQVFFNTAGCSVCKLRSHLNRGFLVSHRSLPQYAIGFSVRSNHNPPPPQAPPSHPNINPGNAEALKDCSPHWLHPLLLLPCICSISSTAPPGPGSAISVFKKNGRLHHGQSDPVGRHRPRLDRDPQVLLVVARALLLLRLRPRHPISAAAATAADVAMATAAAVAAHHQSGEEDEQGEGQEDHQADRVVDPLVVLVRSEVPELVEKLLDAVGLPIHGCQIRSAGSF